MSIPSYVFENNLQRGILLLIISLFLGYGGLGVTVLFFLWTHKILWIWIGSIIYGFSWVLFGLGFLLTGREGLVMIRNKIRKD